MIAILCGTDYNPGGVRGIGPKKALKLVKQYKNNDVLFKEVHAEFDWEEIRDLFVKMKVDKKFRLEWKPPNAEKIRKILVDEHNFSEERVNNALNKWSKVEQARDQTGLNKWF